MKNIPALYIKLASGILAFIILLVCLILALNSCDDGSDVRIYDLFSDEPILSDVPSMSLLNPDSEMRGLWIATVQNINFPTKAGLSVQEQKAEIDDIIATAKELGFNAIFFQVRPCADALYDSDIFPVSRYLSGKQKMFSDGDFDVLAYLLDAAHHQNIRVHAWVNPLRVTAGSKAYPETDVSALHQDHPARKNPEWVRAYADGKLYFDAGIPEVRELVASGVREIVEKYDVDGVIFDDYFYPYPENEEVDGKSVRIEFDDARTYEKYGAAYSNIGDFRRDSINKMMKACYDAIKEVDAECLFGAAPFGIWQNDDGKNGGSATGGLSSYNDIYCDPLAWIDGGYIDYIAPQLYWRFSTKIAPFGTLVDWWNAVLDGKDVDLYICHAAYMYDTWEDIDLEMTEQIEYARGALAFKGSILYGYAAIKNNSAGLSDEAVEVFSDNIIYTDTVSNGVGFAITSHENGCTTSDSSIVLSGVSDPYYVLTLGTASLSRNKNGDFSIVLSLKKGENKFVFNHNEKEYIFTVTRK